MESDLIHSPSKAAFLVSEMNGSSGNASGGMPPGSSLPREFQAVLMDGQCLVEEVSMCVGGRHCRPGQHPQG